MRKDSRDVVVVMSKVDGMKMRGKKCERSEFPFYASNAMSMYPIVYTIKNAPASTLNPPSRRFELGVEKLESAPEDLPDPCAAFAD